MYEEKESASRIAEGNAKYEEGRISLTANENTVGGGIPASATEETNGL